jgi:hypothetical protein
MKPQTMFVIERLNEGENLLVCERASEGALLNYDGFLARASVSHFTATTNERDWLAKGMNWLKFRENARVFVFTFHLTRGH